ncbi:hypothetical protein M8J76_003020 [Diaphorina citri]|nr:hypothetical protein M8J75_000767 [Diaphorina citri]KAI5740356.1 hypothetical protein M8J76_003020 [Diaphorina citri]
MSEETKPKAKEQIPAPNKYMLPTLLGQTGHDPTKHQEPAFTMQGRRPPERVTEQPAPNKYQTADLTRFGHAIAGKMEVSMKGRYDKGRLGVTPGPDKYDLTIPTQAIHPQAPAYTLGGRFETLPPTIDIPGPKYGLPTYIDGTGQVPIAKSSPAFTMHSRVPRNEFDGKIPGPLAYGATPLEIYKSKAPDFTMPGRNPAKLKPNGIPTPNKYDSLINPIGKSGPAFSMSSRYPPGVKILRTKEDNAPGVLTCDLG